MFTPRNQPVASRSIVDAAFKSKCTRGTEFTDTMTSPSSSPYRPGPSTSKLSCIIRCTHVCMGSICTRARLGAAFLWIVNVAVLRAQFARVHDCVHLRACVCISTHKHEHVMRGCVCVCVCVCVYTVEVPRRENNSTRLEPVSRLMLTNDVSRSSPVSPTSIYKIRFGYKR